jgi:hypothetical protein
MFRCWNSCRVTRLDYCSASTKNWIFCHFLRNRSSEFDIKFQVSTQNMLFVRIKILSSELLRWGVYANKNRRRLIRILAQFTYLSEGPILLVIIYYIMIYAYSNLWFWNNGVDLKFMLRWKLKAVFKCKREPHLRQKLVFAKSKL